MNSILQRVDKDFVKHMKKIYGDIDMPIITKKITSDIQTFNSRKKRGSLFDVFYWVIMFSFVAMVLLLGANFTQQFNAKAQASPMFDSDSKDMMQDMEELYTVYIDKGFVLAFIGEVIITFILGMMVAIHPVFFVFYIPGWLFAVYLSSIMSNLYQKAAQVAIMAGAADLIPWTSYFIIWMPVIIGVSGIILATGMYKVWKTGNGG